MTTHTDDCATHARDLCDCSGPPPRSPRREIWSAEAIAARTRLPLWQVQQALRNGRDAVDLLAIGR